MDTKQILSSDGTIYLHYGEVVAMQLIPFTTSMNMWQLSIYVPGFELVKTGTLAECEALRDEIAAYMTFHEVK